MKQQWKSVINLDYIQTDEQAQLMQKTFGCCRFVFNRYLAQRIETYKSERKSVSRFEQDKDMTRLKTELEWLKRG
ncbi:MAG: helix-turn-helix domain-containing protein [Treponema sp.]|nr:helix-turn-helix domain-containing protein [Treponema sp.]